jgi:hypothetical protein
MIGRPQASEAREVLFTRYINRVPGDDIVSTLQQQMEQAASFLGIISEERSLHRYAPEKWTIREVLNHISDTERAFAYRMLWFSRGFETPLEGFDQERSVPAAEANFVTWEDLVADFAAVRAATLTLLRTMPHAGWQRAGVASGNPVSVRALAFLCAGHADHHLAMVKERYL